MAIDAGKFCIRPVDMNEIVPFGVDLFKCFTAAKFIAPFQRALVPAK